MAFFFNCVLEKQHGNKAGELIIVDFNFERILKLDEDNKTDYNGTSTPSQIKTTLITGVRTGGAPQEKQRIIKLFTNYEKRNGQDVIHTITDPDTGEERTITDSTNSENSTGIKDFNKFTDGMTGDLKISSKIKYKIQDCEAFDGAIIQARAENRGSR